MFITKGTKEISIPLLMAKFILIDTKKKYNYLIRENNIDPESIHEWGGSLFGQVFCFDNADGRYFIFCIKSYGAGEVAHEALHLASRIMEYKGIPVCKKTGEVQAYLTQYIVNKVNKELKKGKKK